MSLPFIISPEAELDLSEAKAWYDQQRPGLGEEFVLCIEEAFDQSREYVSEPTTKDSNRIDLSERCQ